MSHKLTCAAGFNAIFGVWGWYYNIVIWPFQMIFILVLIGYVWGWSNGFDACSRINDEAHKIYEKILQDMLKDKFEEFYKREKDKNP